jgi:hypothetical protein
MLTDRTRLGFAVLATMWAGVLAAQTGGRTQVATTRHSPDEFGTQNYTVTTISAMSFTPAGDDGTFDRYYYTSFPGRAFEGSGIGGCLGTGEVGEFYATVDIPSGAVIDYVGIDTWSPNDGVWGVELFLVDRYGNTAPITAFSSSLHDNYDTDYNAAPLGWQLQMNVHNELVLNVEEANVTDFACPLFAFAEIWWRRVVSPPPANPTFNDVPASDFGFQYIEALAASGITGGCGGGNYCPDASLTRRQMAIFLAKALGLHWPY